MNDSYQNELHVLVDRIVLSALRYNCEAGDAHTDLFNLDVGLFTEGLDLAQWREIAEAACITLALVAIDRHGDDRHKATEMVEKAVERYLGRD